MAWYDEEDDTQYYQLDFAADLERRRREEEEARQLLDESRIQPVPAGEPVDVEGPWGRNNIAAYEGLPVVDRAMAEPRVTPEYHATTLQPLPMQGPLSEFGVPNDWLNWDARDGNVVPTGFSPLAPQGSRIVDGRYVPPQGFYTDSPLRAAQMQMAESPEALRGVVAQAPAARGPAGRRQPHPNQPRVMFPAEGGPPQILRPGEMAPEGPSSADILRDITRTAPTQADLTELRQNQNGLTRLQRDVREGRITSRQAAGMVAELQRRVQPTIVRLQELPVMRQALQVAMQREQVHRAAVANAENLRYRNAMASQPGGGPPRANGYVEEEPGVWRVDQTARARGTSSGNDGYAAAQSALDRRLGDETLPEAERTRLQSPEAQEAFILEQMQRQQRIRQQAASLRIGGDLPFDRPEPNAPWGVAVQGMLNDGIAQAMAQDAPEREEQLRQMSARLRQSGGSTGLLLANASETERPLYERLLRANGYYRGEFTPAVDRELATFERRGDGTPMPVSDPQALAARGLRNALGLIGSQAEALRIASDPRTPQAIRDLALSVPQHLATLRVFRWGRTEEENKQSRRSRADGPARQNSPRRTTAPPSSSADVPL